MALVLQRSATGDLAMMEIVARLNASLPSGSMEVAALFMGLIMMGLIK